ncbi:MAG: HEAT repeat domain-containing protein [Longimicrobiales bacterium]
MNDSRAPQLRLPAVGKSPTHLFLSVALTLALQAGTTGVSAQVRVRIVARIVSDEYPVRRAALAELRRMTPRRRRMLTAPLVRLLADPTVRRDAAGEALSLIGPGATGALLDALEDPDPSVRMYAADALGGVWPASPSVVRALIRRVRDPDRAVQGRAIQALGRIGPAAAPSVPALLDALERRGDRPTATLVQALGKIGPSAMAAVPTLIEVLEDDPSSVAVVAQALGEFGDGARLAVPQLLSALARAVANPRNPSTASQARDVIVESLARIGQSAAGPLRAALTDLDPAVREASSEALGRMGVEALDAQTDLQDRLGDPTPSVRAAAAEALGSLGSQALGSAPALEARLADTNAFVRARAADALIALGDPGSLEAVERYRASETSIAESADPRAELWALDRIRASRPATSRYRHALELAREVTLRTEKDVQLRVTVHSGPERPDLLSVWRTEGDSLRHLLSWEAERAAGFAPPHTFTYRGVLLLHLQLRFLGTGQLREDVVYHVSSDGALHRVQLSAPGEHYLPALFPGEGIWKSPSLDFRADVMGFSFGIWREGDTNCCPSGGQVQGVFELRGAAVLDPTTGAYQSTYRITPVSFTRLPPGSG